MSKQTVNIGTSANDGTGDPLRTAFDKTNDNFIELYNALGGDDVVNLINNDEEIELLATANKISFLYSTETLIPRLQFLVIQIRSIDLYTKRPLPTQKPMAIF